MSYANLTQPSRLRSRLTALAVLMLVALAAPAQSYLWEVTAVSDRFVTDLRCTDLGRDQWLTIEWSYQNLGSVTPKFEVQRGEGGAFVTLAAETTAKTLTDGTFTWSTPGAPHAYQYRVRVVYDEANSMGLPAPPMGANPQDIYTRQVASGMPWSTIDVTPVKLDAFHNQTADSRLDPRYGNPTFLDYQFASRTYRGGLFAGFASDSSRIGRAFLKFTPGPLSPGQALWAANVHAYHTRSLQDGNTTIGAQIVADTWDGPTLKWSAAPTLNPASATKTAVVTGSTVGGHATGMGWVRWGLFGELLQELTGDGVVSVGLASTNENNGGWTYFQKKEVLAAAAPCMLYALGDTLRPLTLTISPTYVTGGSTPHPTATLTLNGAANSGGTVVGLSSSNTDVATVPASVTVPASRATTTFTVTTYPVFFSQTVTITALLNGKQTTATLDVHPNWGW